MKYSTDVMCTLFWLQPLFERFFVLKVVIKFLFEKKRRSQEFCEVCKAIFFPKTHGEMIRFVSVAMHWYRASVS
jgi:hypothetical protein